MFSKKFMSKLVAVAILAVSATPAFASTTQFSDVTDATYSNYVDAINFMSGLGIMVGSTDKTDDTKTKFGPDDKVTRAQVAKILDLALGYGKIVASAKPAKFDDVKSDNWASQYIGVASEKGLVKGSGNGKFAPEGNVTYAQYATMALRALGYKDEDLSGSWPFNFLSKASDVGIFNGLDTVSYDQPALRKDIAVMTQNLLFTSTKEDIENNVYVYGNDAIEANSNVNHVQNGLVSRPRWLIDTVKKVIGVEHISGVVVADKTVDPSLADKITVSSGLGTTDATTNLNNNKTTYALSVPDSAKKDYALGSKVSFWYSTNISTRNNIIYDTTSEDKKVADAYVTSLPATKASTFETMVDPSSTSETSVKDKAFGANAYLVLNGRYWNNIASISDNDFASTKVGLLKYAKVKLYDYNDDKKIDFAVIDQEIKPQIVSKNYVAADKAVYVYDAWANDATDDTKVDLSTDGATVTVTGAASKVEDIKANDVVYVKRSADNKLINIDVVREVVSGKVVGTERNTDGTMKTITVGTNTYKVDDSVKTTSINLNDNISFIKGKATVDAPKNDKVIKYTNFSVAAMDLSNYGIITAASDTSKDLYGQTIRVVRFNSLTSGTRDITVNAQTYAYVTGAGLGQAYRFDPSVAVGSTGVQFSGVNVNGSNLTSSYYYGYVVPGTRVFMSDALGNITETTAAQLNIATEAANGRVVGVINLDSRLYGLTSQGYSALLVIQPTTYGNGYYGDRTGQGFIKNVNQYKEEVYNGINTRLYDVVIDGVSQVIRIKSDIVNTLVAPYPGSTTIYFNKLFVDVNNVVVGVTPMNLDDYRAVVTSIANGQIRLNNSFSEVYNAQNAKVYDKDGNAISLDYLASYYLTNYKNVIVDVELANGYYNTVAFIKIVDCNNN